MESRQTESYFKEKLTTRVYAPYLTARLQNVRTRTGKFINFVPTRLQDQYQSNLYTWTRRYKCPMPIGRMLIKNVVHLFCGYYIMVIS